MRHYYPGAAEYKEIELKKKELVTDRVFPDFIFRRPIEFIIPTEISIKTNLSKVFFCLTQDTLNYNGTEGCYIVPVDYKNNIVEESIETIFANGLDSQPTTNILKAPGILEVSAGDSYADFVKGTSDITSQVQIMITESYLIFDDKLNWLYFESNSLSLTFLIFFSGSSFNSFKPQIPNDDLASKEELFQMLDFNYHNSGMDKFLANYLDKCHFK